MITIATTSSNFLTFLPYLSPLQSLSSSYITNGKKRTPDKLDEDPKRIKSVLKIFHQEDDHLLSKKTKEVEKVPEKNDIEVSKRRLEALNEFTSNEKIISASFFHIFLLGKSYKRDGSLLPANHRHLLLQYTGIAGRCHDLLFFLFDQTQRFGNIGGINSVVRNHKESFDQFTSMVKNKNFRKVLQKAKKDPTGRTAKKVMKLVTPILTTGGSNTCLGALERNDAISKINAMCLRYGMPTLFLTIAVDDVNNFNS